MVSIDDQADARLWAPFVDALLELMDRPGVATTVAIRLHDFRWIDRQIKPCHLLYQCVYYSPVIVSPRRTARRAWR
jgi:hypothetical protein